MRSHPYPCQPPTPCCYPYPAFRTKQKLTSTCPHQMRPPPESSPEKKYPAIRPLSGNPRHHHITPKCTSKCEVAFCPIPSFSKTQSLVVVLRWSCHWYYHQDRIGGTAGSHTASRMRGSLLTVTRITTHPPHCRVAFLGETASSRLCPFGLDSMEPNQANTGQMGQTTTRTTTWSCIPLYTIHYTGYHREIQPGLLGPAVLDQPWMFLGCLETK